MKSGQASLLRGHLSRDLNEVEKEQCGCGVTAFEAVRRAHAKALWQECTCGSGWHSWRDMGVREVGNEVRRTGRVLQMGPDQ